MPLNCFGDASHIAVERALAEFRAARPVAIRSGDSLVLAFSAEGLNVEKVGRLPYEAVQDAVSPAAQ